MKPIRFSKAVGYLVTALVSAAAHAARVLQPKISKRQRHDDDADGKTGATVGPGEVHGVVGGLGVEQQRHDGDKGGRKERGKTRSETHQKRLKPAEIPEGDSKKHAVPPGPIDIVCCSHLK